MDCTAVVPTRISVSAATVAQSKGATIDAVYFVASAMGSVAHFTFATDAHGDVAHVAGPLSIAHTSAAATPTRAVPSLGATNAATTLECPPAAPTAQQLNTITTIADPRIATSVYSAAPQSSEYPTAAAAAAAVVTAAADEMKIASVPTPDFAAITISTADSTALFLTTMPPS